MEKKRPYADKADVKVPTMADVANLVGVSRQLVGLVFRNAEGVSSETAAKIRLAAKKIGYRPNLAAQSLRRDASKNIGFLFHAEQSSMLGILPAMYKFAKAAGFNLVISAVSSSHNENDAIEELLGYRCEGVVFSASELPHRRLQRIAREIPMVSLGRRMEQVRAGMVSSNGEAGVFALTSHLINLGHTDIAYVFAKDMRDSNYRLEGYLAAMDAEKLKTRVITIEGDYAEIGGSLAADILLKTNLPTAVICNNDQSALGLSHRFLQFGIKIPQDVSVTGFDDTVAHFPFMSLTTVRQDPQELAERAITDLVARIRGEKYLAETYLTPAKLIVRSSTAKPRKDAKFQV